MFKTTSVHSMLNSHLIISFKYSENPLRDSKTCPNLHFNTPTTYTTSWHCIFPVNFTFFEVDKVNFTLFWHICLELGSQGTGQRLKVPSPYWHSEIGGNPETSMCMVGRGVCSNPCTYELPIPEPATLPPKHGVSVLTMEQHCYTQY